MGGSRGRKSAKVDPGKMEQYKEVCPPHKVKDLDALVKSLKGNDEEIMAKIQEWWFEPAVEEPEWENVDKKGKKKQLLQQQQQQRESSGRGGRGGPGRGGRGNRGGGRGSGSERRSRAERRRSPPPKPQEDDAKKQSEMNGAHDVPTPVTIAPAPKGAWGRSAATAPVPEPAPVLSPAKPVTPVKQEIAQPVPVDVGIVAPQDPTPSGINGSASTTPSKAGSNVWATKGSAHLIRAEKPKPSPQQMRMSAAEPKSSVKRTQIPQPSSPLESGLPSSLSGGSWNATAPPSLEEMTQSASSVAEATLGSTAAEVSGVQEAPGSPVKPAPVAPAPANVVNMGHWGSGEGDDSQHLDFGFGSFGPEGDVSTQEPISQAPPPAMPTKEASTATMSPARPPPGLSIGGGGMPPMPANAVLVHELEGKLETTTLGRQPEEQVGAPQPMSANLSSQPQPPPPPGQLAGPPPGVTQSYIAAYGGMGMYNYSNQGTSAFMGQNPAPGLGQPQQKPGISGPGGAPQHAPPAGGLYGSTAPLAGTPGDSVTAPSSTDTSTTAAAIPPPGMPNTMPYNPALFYGQQPYQMGQPHGGVAGYGYGAYGAQFGGAGFYGQQVMGQSGGYPSYDDQPQGRNDYQSKGNNRYQNSRNQYQSQFNPQQHGGYGYGGQPMGGYNVDHFNQRGGYGHGPPTDPYGMPQQQGSSYDGKKGGRFQQHQQFGGDQQQTAPFLGGNANDTSSSNNQGGTSGWSNNNNTNTNQGGWGQPSAWQGGN